MRAGGVAYELECYDVGHLEACLRLAEEGVIELPAHFQFVMGVRGGIAATRGQPHLPHLQAAARIHLRRRRHRPPPASHGGAVAAHRGPCALGLEDNIYFEKGVLAEGSYELVARVAALAREVGREVATPGPGAPDPRHREEGAFAMNYRVARFRVRPSEVAAAEKAIIAFVAQVADEPGTLRYESFREPDGVSYLHVMIFADDDAQASTARPRT